jgi:hypothetical protein
VFSLRREWVEFSDTDNISHRWKSEEQEQDWCGVVVVVVNDDDDGRR